MPDARTYRRRAAIKLLAAAEYRRQIFYLKRANHPWHLRTDTADLERLRQDHARCLQEARLYRLAADGLAGK